ncbi:hypothetical protein [Microbacterium sp. LWH10-1.2]|uniref:DUF7927 domain-containing protein n=1 Tax=Microbacterium sp. LWH10-1.2 TaxID=3135255 RepID=UPI003138DC8F
MAKKAVIGARGKSFRARIRAVTSGVLSSALLASSLVAAGLVLPSAAQAAPGDPFDPAAPVVYIAQGAPSQLQRAETTGTGTFAFTDEGGPAPVSYNAIGFNPANSYMYGIVSGNGTAALPIGALVRIGQGGVVTRVGTTIYTHPATGSTRFFAGAFNPATGLYYVSDSGPNTTMRVINATTGAIVQTIDFGQQPGVQDFAFKDGFAWGANAAGDIRRLNVTTGAIAVFPAVIPPGAGGYGGVWTFGNGNLGFSSNSTGDVVQLEVLNGATATPTFRVVSVVPGPSSTLNDGTSIPGLPADLAVVKTGPPTYESGDRISYSVTVTNNGAGVSSGWTVTDTLPAGLSNPTVTGSVTATIAGSTITASGGRLNPGQSVTFTIAADTNTPLGTCLTNTASVAGNEADPVSSNNQSATTSCDLGLSLVKTSNASADTRPGDVVTYTVTATNTGAGAFTPSNPATVFDDLTGVLDDATYNNDATSSVPGTIDYVQPLLSWSGALASGASVNLTYSVTIGSGGDGTARNVAWRPNDPGDPTPPTCDPAPGGVDAATGQPCAVTSFPLPRLTIDKSADRTDLPAVGDTVTYTVVVTNPGPGVYTAAAPATATDDLTEVLDDATFEDATLTASSGTATRTGNTMSWSGALGAGQQATITYSVTYTGDGDQVLRNSACIPAGDTVPGSPSCDTVRIPGAALTQWKTATPSSDPVVAGSTITYTLFFDNDGQTAATVNAIDDLTYVLDDAVVTTEPTSPNGLAVVRNGAEISITGSVPVGATYTVVYTVTILPDDQRADSVASNFLLTPGEDPPPGGVCTPVDPQAPTCTSTPITGVTYTKTVSSSETPVRTGTELAYTITVVNTGATVVDVLRDDDLGDVLDDATLTSGPTSDTPSVTATGPAGGILSLGGTLAPGATATVTYTVTVNPLGDRGNNSAANFLVPPGTPPGPVCDPATEQCTVTPIQGYTVAKAADVDTVVPGGVVTYTVTVVNAGAVAFTAANPASFTDDLSGVLDDAVYNGDVTAGGSVAGNTLTWSGPLAVGETVTVTYSVTVDDPPAGDLILGNAVVPTAPGGECDPEGACTTDTPVSSFTVAKTVDVASAMAGDTVTYTVTVTNTGQSAFTAAAPASFQDDLSGVLDDAAYNNDVSAGGSVAGSLLTWSGPLAVGETATVTYSVTVNDPLTGDQDLANVVTPTTPGGSCDPAAECVTNTPVASYTVAKTASAASARPGETITYTVTVTNTGDVDYTNADPASFTDDLSGVLDDAVYNGDVTTGGSVAGNTLTWSGPLAAGQTETVTYSVTVDDPITGDFSLQNVVVPTGPGGSCDGVCTTTTPLGSFRVVKQADAVSVVPGDVVTYSISVTNTGQVPYTAADPASFTDDLSAVLDDATYNNDVASSSGAGTGYTAPVLSWSGPLAVGATVTITYSVTVNSPATGDRSMSNTVLTPPGSGGNCAAGSTDPACVANVPAASYSIEKTAEPATTGPGDVVTYTVTVTNTGALDYTAAAPASFTDDLSRVLDDASYNGDVSVGGSIAGDTLTWSGPLAVGETLQVTYSVTVDDPVDGDFLLRNVVAPSAPGGECVPDACATETPIASYTVQKQADVADVVIGGVVTYTVTVTNIGQVPYTDAAPAVFDDDLSGVLDDATYNGDATGGAIVAGGLLSWTGALAVGETVTVTYSVTVNQPATGDQILRNAVTASGPGGGCAEPGGCVTETPVASYRVDKNVSTTQAWVGDKVTFTITVTNTGRVPYTNARPASFTDDLSSALAVGTYNADASSGATYSAPALSWQGALDVGQSVTVSYSVTLRKIGDIKNVVVTPPGSGGNCSTGATDADCRTDTKVSAAGLAITGGVVWAAGGIGGSALLGLGLLLLSRRRREAMR